MFTIIVRFFLAFIFRKVMYRCINAVVGYIITTLLQTVCRVCRWNFFWKSVNNCWRFGQK